MSAKIFCWFAIIIGIIITAAGMIIGVEMYDRQVLGNILVIIGIVWVCVGIIGGFITYFVKNVL